MFQLFQTYFARDYSKFFIYFRLMLQAFHLDVPYVAMAIHICCVHILQMFHLLHTYVAASVSCGECFMFQATLGWWDGRSHAAHIRNQGAWIPMCKAIWSRRRRRSPLASWKWSRRGAAPTCIETEQCGLGRCNWSSVSRVPGMETRCFPCIRGRAWNGACCQA
jgi:hypothetical protein